MTHPRPMPAHAAAYLDNQLHLVPEKIGPMKRNSFADLRVYSRQLTVGFSAGEMALFALAACLLAVTFARDEVRHQLALIGLGQER